ncbi:hypothetical protein L226DRAFT_530844 [Lentinus tigrinus ALCF2SS1-7]|uniref:Uncharacterized protein n=1 Tax=Lentinus tigrinus ALCF2SS1-6 TaxID=1328759 RepID=A0A5C2SQI1_9APHY|nr:hypothetical protein L227DRAFT_607091 [Lentinus tigrinus ALCF2SS1-6]RPD78981.1 hypothetical protein L226DRAFT_530844 [Lentinus tigrinus ALCF2SS1-7]
MLAFGLKAVWFSLSLTGFLSSIAALPAFAQAMNGYLIPVLYTVINFLLQGLFCLGMVWRMDPFKIPRAFCIVQPALQGVAWSFMTVITSCMTGVTSYAILRPAGGVPASPAYIRSRLRWQPACLFMAFFPMAAFAAYLVLALKFDAVQPTDGLNCDATNPVWVRLLSYAGVPLLLAIPSLLLTCTAAFQFHIHSPRHTHSRSFVRSNDHFTPVPLRQQSKFRLNHGWQEAKGVDAEPYTAGSMPQLTHSTTGLSADQRSVTPSGTIVVAEAIPSPPDSLSSAHARLTSGRAPISPGVAKSGMRYHLPFQWQPPSTRTSSDLLRDSPELTYSRHTPSPLIFAMPAEEAGKGPNTTMVSVTPDPSDRIFEAAPWLKDEKAYLRQLERANNAERKHETSHDDDEIYDAVSGSLRWIRNSDDTASVAKSELEFARTPQREVFEEVFWRPSPVDPSTYDAGLTETPIPNFTRMVWRILFFQLFSSATQIIATLSSLIDMFTQNQPPSPFGTHHVALILAAWAPPIAFGIIPWRRMAR